MDVFVDFRFKGKNETKKNTDGIVIKFSGDSPIDYDSMHIEPKDLLHGGDLVWRSIKDEPRLKIFLIEFRRPLHPNELFDIRVNFVWPSTQTRKSDYIFYLLNLYKRGVEKFSSKVTFKSPLKRFELCTLKIIVSTN